MTLQRSVLPASLPRIEGAQLAARYLPGTAELDVGGDWFDAIPLADGRLGLVVGDVVGKGVEAAAAMAQLRNGLRAFSLDPLKPASALARLNRLAGESLETTFATLVYAVIDPRKRICRIASAGHPPPIVAFADGRVELIEGGRGLPLGVGPDTRYRQTTVELPTGSVLLLYSDGLVERRGHSIDEGLTRVTEAVSDGPRHPEQLVEHIVERLVGSTERGDDIALLAFRLLAIAPEPLDLRVPSDVGALGLVRDSRANLARGNARDSGGCPRSRPRRVGGVCERGRARTRAHRRARDSPRGYHERLGANRGRGFGQLEAARKEFGPRPRPPAHALADVVRRDRARRGGDPHHARERACRGRVTADPSLLGKLLRKARSAAG